MKFKYIQGEQINCASNGTGTGTLKLGLANQRVSKTNLTKLLFC